MPGFHRASNGITVVLRFQPWNGIQYYRKSDDPRPVCLSAHQLSSSGMCIPNQIIKYCLCIPARNEFLSQCQQCNQFFLCHLAVIHFYALLTRSRFCFPEKREINERMKAETLNVLIPDKCKRYAVRQPDQAAGKHRTVR